MACTAFDIIKASLEENGNDENGKGKGSSEKTERNPRASRIVSDALCGTEGRWWQTEGREPKNGERIVNSPVERETVPTALAAGKALEAKQIAAGSRPRHAAEDAATKSALTEDELVEQVFRTALDEVLRTPVPTVATDGVPAEDGLLGNIANGVKNMFGGGAKKAGANVGAQNFLQSKVIDHRKTCKAKPGNCPFERQAAKTAKQMGLAPSAVLGAKAAAVAESSDKGKGGAKPKDDPAFRYDRGSGEELFKETDGADGEEEGVDPRWAHEGWNTESFHNYKAQVAGINTKIHDLEKQLRDANGAGDTKAAKKAQGEIDALKEDLDSANLDYAIKALGKAEGGAASELAERAAEEKDSGKEGPAIGKLKELCGHAVDKVKKMAQTLMESIGFKKEEIPDGSASEGGKTEAEKEDAKKMADPDAEGAEASGSPIVPKDDAGEEQEAEEPATEEAEMSPVTEEEQRQADKDTTTPVTEEEQRQADKDTTTPVTEEEQRQADKDTTTPVTEEEQRQADKDTLQEVTVNEDRDAQIANADLEARANAFMEQLKTDGNDYSNITQEQMDQKFRDAGFTDDEITSIKRMQATTKRQQHEDNIEGLKQKFPESAGAIDAIDKKLQGAALTEDDANLYEELLADPMRDTELRQFLKDKCGFSDDDCDMMDDLITTANMMAHESGYTGKEGEPVAQYKSDTPPVDKNPADGKNGGTNPPTIPPDQPNDDAVNKDADGKPESIEDHWAHCKADPKENCPFIKGNATPEQIAALKGGAGNTSASGSAPTGTPPADGTPPVVPPAEPPKDNSVTDRHGVKVKSIPESEWKKRDLEKGYSDAKEALNKVISDGLADKSLEKDADGNIVATTREAQAKLNAALKAADDAEDAVKNFKPEDGETKAEGTNAPADEEIPPPPAEGPTPDTESSETGVETAGPSTESTSPESATGTEPGVVESELPDKLPPYTPPEGYKLTDDDQVELYKLRQNYANAKTHDERQKALGAYEYYTNFLNEHAAQMKADSEHKEKGALSAIWGAIKSTISKKAKAKADKGGLKDYSLPSDAKQPVPANILAAIADAQKSFREAKTDDVRRAAADRYNMLTQEADKLARGEQGTLGGPDSDRSDSATELVSHEDGKVTAANGKAYAPVDDSWIDMSASKPGGLADKPSVDTKIAEALAQYGIDVNAAETTKKESVGPYDTTITIKNPNKLSTADAKNLADDIAFQLGRFDDKGNSEVSVDYNDQSRTVTIGIAHRQDERGSVSFGDVYKTQEWKDAVEKGKKDGKLPMILGTDKEGKPMIGNMDDFVHLLIAGSTGSGKSVRLNTALVSMMMAMNPDELQMIMIDPKGTELSSYNKDPHLAQPVITDMDKAAGAINWTVDEMENRNKLFQRVTDETGLACKDVASYNRLAAAGKLPADMPKKLPRMVLCVDEMASLMDTHGPDVEKSIKMLGQKARSAGIHLILATQRPDAKSIPTGIQSNIPTKMYLSTSEKDAKYGIVPKAARGLSPRGPFYLEKDNGNSAVYGNGAFLSEDEQSGFSRAARGEKATETNPTGGGDGSGTTAATGSSASTANPAAPAAPRDHSFMTPSENKVKDSSGGELDQFSTGDGSRVVAYPSGNYRVYEKGKGWSDPMDYDGVKAFAEAHKAAAPAAGSPTAAAGTSATEPTTPTGAEASAPTAETGAASSSTSSTTEPPTASESSAEATKAPSLDPKGNDISFLGEGSSTSATGWPKSFELPNGTKIHAYANGSFSSEDADGKRSNGNMDYFSMMEYAAKNGAKMKEDTAVFKPCKKTFTTKSGSPLQAFGLGKRGQFAARYPNGTYRFVTYDKDGKAKWGPFVSYAAVRAQAGRNGLGLPQKPAETIPTDSAATATSTSKNGTGKAASAETVPTDPTATATSTSNNGTGKAASAETVPTDPTATATSTSNNGTGKAASAETVPTDPTATATSTSNNGTGKAASAETIPTDPTATATSTSKTGAGTAAAESTPTDPKIYSKEVKAAADKVFGTKGIAGGLDPTVFGKRQTDVAGAKELYEEFKKHPGRHHGGKGLMQAALDSAFAIRNLTDEQAEDICEAAKFEDLAQRYIRGGDDRHKAGVKFAQACQKRLRGFAEKYAPSTPEMKSFADKITQKSALTNLTGDKDRPIIMDDSGRAFTQVDIGGRKITFYCSSGKAGKTSVEAGRWYPIAGCNGALGWINKTTGFDMSTHFMSPLLREISDALTQKFPADKLPRTRTVKSLGTGKHDRVYENYKTDSAVSGTIDDVVGKINDGLKYEPADDNYADTHILTEGPDKGKSRVEENFKDMLDAVHRVENGLKNKRAAPTTTDEAICSSALDFVRDVLGGTTALDFVRGVLET